MDYILIGIMLAIGFYIAPFVIDVVVAVFSAILIGAYKLITSIFKNNNREDK